MTPVNSHHPAPPQQTRASISPSRTRGATRPRSSSTPFPLQEIVRYPQFVGFKGPHSGIPHTVSILQKSPTTGQVYQSLNPFAEPFSSSSSTTTPASTSYQQESHINVATATPNDTMNPLSRWTGGPFDSRSMITPGVRVVFETGVVDMIGAPCTGTSYSLPGMVVVTLPALPSQHSGWQRQIKDVTVILEGQSEYWDAAGRHHPMRLFSSTLPLIPLNEPIIVPSYNPFASSSPSVVKISFPFDLRVPGWVPPTMLATYTTNLYGVVANVTVGWVDRPVDNPFSRQIRPPSPETARGRSPYTAFIVRRHRVPTALRPTATVRDRTVTRERESVQLGKKLDFLIVLPEWVDMHAESLDLSLRVRIRDCKGKSKTQGAVAPAAVSSIDPDVSGVSDFSDLSNMSIDLSNTSVATPVDEARHLTYITELGMEVEEFGRFCSEPATFFIQQCPLPEQQPSSKSNVHRLLGPSSRPAAFSALPTPVAGTESHRLGLQRLCLLSDEGTQRRYQFPANGKGIGGGWRRIRFVLPMPAVNSPGDASRPTPDCDTPFMKLRHVLRIRVVLKAPGFDEPETIIVELPIRFGSAPETLPTPASKGPPPYIAVFHENGELRDCDPLPLYPGTPVAATFPNPTGSATVSDGHVLFQEMEAGAANLLSSPELGGSERLPSLDDDSMDVDAEGSEDTHSHCSTRSLHSGGPSNLSCNASRSLASSPATSPEHSVVKLPTVIPGEWGATNSL